MDGSNELYTFKNDDEFHRLLFPLNPYEIKALEEDIVKKVIQVPYSNKKMCSYYDLDGNKIIPYDNIENRNFSEEFVVVRLDNNDIRIFNKKGKQLKIHTCIIYDENMDLELLKKIKSLKYRISDMSINSLASKITIDLYEYIVYSSDTNELNNKKIEVLNDIKQIVSKDLISEVEDKIKKLKQ